MKARAQESAFSACQSPLLPNQQSVLCFPPSFGAPKAYFPRPLVFEETAFQRAPVMKMYTRPGAVWQAKAPYKRVHGKLLLAYCKQLKSLAPISCMTTLMPNSTNAYGKFVWYVLL